MTQHIQLFPCSRRTPRPFHRARREWKMKLFQSQLREMGLSRCFRPKLESIETCGATMLVWVVGSQTLSFACTPCLKGHRSNSCAHYERPLVEVKGKGRPVSQCGHCRTRRSGGLSLALSTGGDVVGADVLGSNPDTATPTSSSPSCSVSSKKPRGHSHHKCLCGLEAAARARRSVDAAFSVYTRKGRTPVSLSFSTTEHTLFQATLEASRTSKMLIQTVRRKDKAAHASTTLSPTLFPAATAPIPRLLTPPTVSSSSSTSVPAVPSTTTDGPIATAPPDLQQQQVETDTADFILHFERMSVSTPESLSLTFGVLRSFTSLIRANCATDRRKRLLKCCICRK
ncbi:hypothetical protein BC830DRAFT_640651 [Chytriomyces sp. MP71]|nr:hypothetical protein BC830DRAFT_640651 [Chytriomyces sp. MP71]